MANKRIKDLSPDAVPSKTDVLAVDSLTTRGVTIENAVKIGRPFASQAQAEAGTDYTTAMNPLTVKQAVAAQGAVSFASFAQGAKADSAVQPALTITAGDGLTGGGTLAANRTLALNSASIASLALADSAIQAAGLVAYAAPIAQAVPAGGTTGQVLAKASDTANDVEWTAAGNGDMLAATYDPQGKAADAFARANHTGTQAISTVAGLQTALDAKNIQLGTAIPTTSGAAIDFTGIPAGVKRVTVLFDGVSTTTSTGVTVQIGSNGSVETTGYNNTDVVLVDAVTPIVSGDSGGLIIPANPAQSRYGDVVFSLVSGNVWVYSGKLASRPTPVFHLVSGGKTLVGVLDRVRATAGGGTFDGGSINVSWEF